MRLFFRILLILATIALLGFCSAARRSLSFLQMDHFPLFTRVYRDIFPNYCHGAAEIPFADVACRHSLPTELADTACRRNLPRRLADTAVFPVGNSTVT